MTKGNCFITKGFKFKVVKSNLIGIINSVYYDDLVKDTMYSISFYDYCGNHYLTASVYPDTVKRNIELGHYEKV